MQGEQTGKKLWKEYAQAALEAEHRGDQRLAEDNYRLSLILVSNSSFPKPEDIGEALINYADFLTVQQRYRQAEQYYRQAIELYNTIFGDDNLVTGMIYRVLGEIYNYQEQTLQANLLFVRSDQIWKKQAS